MPVLSVTIIARVVVTVRGSEVFGNNFFMSTNMILLGFKLTCTGGEDGRVDASFDWFGWLGGLKLACLDSLS
jgi:hypothetical protein